MSQKAHNKHLEFLDYYDAAYRLLSLSLSDKFKLGYDLKYVNSNQLHLKSEELDEFIFKKALEDNFEMFYYEVISFEDDKNE